MRIFLFGAGYSAQAFARKMASEAERIDGTTRHEQKFPLLEQAGIKPMLFDGETPSPDLLDRLSQSTHVVVSISRRERRSGGRRR